RVHEDAPAVRRSHRAVPGAATPDGGHAHPCRAGALDELSCRHARRRAAGPRAPPCSGGRQGGSGERLPVRWPAGGAAPRGHGRDRRDRGESSLSPPDGAGDGAGRHRPSSGAVRRGERAGGGHMSGADYTTQGAVAVIRLDNPPVNGLAQAVRAGILAGLDRATADPAISAVVLAGAGKSFAAGADGDLLAGAVAFAGRVASRRPLPVLRERVVAHLDPEAFLGFARNTVAAVAKGYPAPLKCVEAVSSSLKPFEEGSQIERQLFIGLVNSPESKALRHVFLAERAASKIPDVPEDTPTRAIGSAAVIGAGTMGGGIAMCFANAGIPVRLLEVKQEALEKGLATIRK